MGYHAENLTAIRNISHSFAAANDSFLPPELFQCRQEHKANVVEVTLDQEAGTLTGDAMFTTTTRPIGVVTADCLPILVSSSVEPFVAAIHGGWKGLSSNIIENSFSAFRQAGVSLTNLHVAIGPAIQSCCYEVRLPMIDELEASHGYLWKKKAPPWSKQRKHLDKLSVLPRAPSGNNEAWLDLALYSFYLLEAAGLERDQVQKIDKCTYCSSPDLGSYRRRNHRAEEKTVQYSWIRSTCGL
jgi:YfiH family protein